MAKKEYTAEQLHDFCLEETTVECGKCKTISGHMGDADYASERFFEEGWKATPNNIYCPKCAKKYLKSK